MRYPILLAVVFLIGCSGGSTPTTVQQCTTTVVFAAADFYVQRQEPEREFGGELEFRNVPATPNGRDHRFFVGGTPVYSGGIATEPIFRDAAGTRVTLRGKLVDAGFGPEIWTASLSSCR